MTTNQPLLNAARAYATQGLQVLTLHHPIQTGTGSGLRSGRLPGVRGAGRGQGPGPGGAGRSARVRVTGAPGVALGRPNSQPSGLVGLDDVPVTGRGDTVA